MSSDATSKRAKKFQVRASPTGAQGVFAIAPLAEQTFVKVDCFVLIMKEPPVNTQESDSSKCELYAEQWETVCARFDTRAPKVQDAILELEPQQKRGESNATWLGNVLKVNGWNHAIHQPHGRKNDATMLLIFKGSNFNHSCAPMLQPRLFFWRKWVSRSKRLIQMPRTQIRSSGWWHSPTSRREMRSM